VLQQRQPLALQVHQLQLLLLGGMYVTALQVVKLQLLPYRHYRLFSVAAVQYFMPPVCQRGPGSKGEGLLSFNTLD